MENQIGSYSVLCYGSPSGYQTNRAQIQLLKLLFVTHVPEISSIAGSGFPEAVHPS